MKRFRHLWLVAVFVAGPSAGAQYAEPQPLRDPGRGTAIGIEYVLLDQKARIPIEAHAFGEAGLTAAKHYAEHVEWGRMQAGPRSKIDFSRLDPYVVEYQKAGFGELVLCLKSHARWAARESGLLQPKNPVPNAEHMDAYATWIRAVVERYDGDGRDDVPGLRWPVRLVEIGSEFSSYEPEPAGEYLEMLERAYRAAHEASPDVVVAHAAFLTVTAFDGRPEPGEANYRAAFDGMNARISRQHDYADVSRVLDRHDLFDAANLHALSDPYDLEDQVRWLRWELARRGAEKSILVSDTIPTSYVGFGPATTAEGPEEGLGILLRPAKPADRRRLAEFFQKLVRKDAETLRWTRGFVAADTVERVVIACALEVDLVDIAFNIDLPFLTEPALEAGAGISAWAGALGWRFHRVSERRPLYFAIRQLMSHLQGHEKICRVDAGDARARVYRVEKEGPATWVAWLEVDRVVLPGDPEPEIEVEFETGSPAVAIEQVITEPGIESGRSSEAATDGGKVRLALGRIPVYVIARP